MKNMLEADRVLTVMNAGFPSDLVNVPIMG